jgi:hypothetical protein
VLSDYALLVAVVVAVVLAIWLAVERIAAGRLAVRDRVVVNLLTGQAVHGVLWSRRGRFLVLRNAELYEPGNARPNSMDGETIVDRDQVLIVQRLGV